MSDEKIRFDLSPPPLVEDPDRFCRSGEFVGLNEIKPNIKLISSKTNIQSICLVKFDFIGIQIAIGIEIDPLNSDFDSEPDSDMDYPGVRTAMLFVGMLPFKGLTRSHPLPVEPHKRTI